MKEKILLIILLSVNVCAGQNLVINPGFEDTLNCPYQINQVNFANGWDSWGGTPDYYNSCANSSTPGYGVPHNFRGYQNAHSGNAYAGLFTFTVFNVNQREFIGGTLSSPLVIGEEYFVSFWVNHPDTSVVSITTDKLGIKFSTVAFNYFASPDTVNNNPHIFHNSIISDTTNWVLIEGSFIADSAYTHFGIGNYFEDAQTNTSQIGTSSANYAYYFVDDFCISADASSCQSATGIPENKADDTFEIYPNPANGICTIRPGKVSVYENSVLTISDFTGKCIQKINLNEWNHELNVELSDGIHLVNISNSQSAMTKKIVIQH